MTPEALKAKYKDSVIMGIDDSVLHFLPGKGMVTAKDEPALSCAVAFIEKNLMPKLRCEAETDARFKQTIPYALVRNVPSGEIFATTRLGGDNRLKEKISIGLGGHMDKGESFLSCLFRELKEEIGLSEGDIAALTLYGYILNDSSEVDSVHFGIVYIVDTHNPALQCLETDKLTGSWFSLEQLLSFRESGLLESWSEMLYDSLTVKNPHKKACDVCGKVATVTTACSAYGPISLAFCAECLSRGLGPYSTVILYIASAGHFPGEIKDEYVRDVRRMLPMWGKTEAEFIRDVDKMIKKMEDSV